MQSLSRILAAVALGLCALATARAQFSQAPDLPQSALGSPALKPPAGSKVAIVEFDDMQCPMCASWNPVLIKAAAKYHVAWVRHDSLITGHPLSPQEAVNARWFDSRSPELGAAYRNTVFAQQQSIASREDLARCTAAFAQQHGIELPFVTDPQGKLMDAVQADCRLARSLGVHETPTVYIVTTGSREPGYSVARVRDLSLLFAYLDQATAATAPPARKKS